MKKTVTIALIAGCILASAAQWDFKDGENSKIVREKDNSALNGKINNPALCSWAREDDRGWFLTFKNGGSVIVPHADSLNFEGGFTAKIHFSCDFSKITRLDFANLFTKGKTWQDGYCVMVRRNGTLLVELKNFSPDYKIIPLELESNVEYTLELYVNPRKVTVYLNGRKAYEYTGTGTFNMTGNTAPLVIGSMGGYLFTGNLYSLELTPWRTPPEKPEPVQQENVLKAPKNPPDPRDTVIVDNFPAFEPKMLIREGNAPATSEEKTWICRKASFLPGSRFVIHPPLSPDAMLTFDPKLKGEYDVYLGVRAIHIPTSIQAGISGEKDWFTVSTLSVGPHHRSMEALLRRNVKMDGRKLLLASTGKIPAYVCCFKFVPSNPGRPGWKQDPACQVSSGAKLTGEMIEKQQEAMIADKITSGYFKELVYVEGKKLPKLSEESAKRGFILFEQPWMSLLFQNSVPASDLGIPKLEIHAAPGEFEPATLGIHSIAALSEVSLQPEGMFPAGIAAKISVVEAIPKRTGNYNGQSEFMVGPQYLEANHSFSMKAGETRQFWLTVCPGENVAPGTYMLKFKLTAGKYTETIPLAVHVRPFRLARIRDTDIGFCVSFGGKKPEECAAMTRDMAEHGMTMLESGNVFAIKGNSMETQEIDFEKSPITPIAETFRKYTPNACIQAECGLLGNDLPKFVKQLEAHAKKNHWPRIYYKVCDEVTTNTQDFPVFIERMKILKSLGVPVTANHIWYKTSRPIQKEVDAAIPYIDIFNIRFNTRNLFYVDSWDEINAECVKRGKRFQVYNSHNALMFAQTGAMRFCTGWFFRTFGQNCAGQLFYHYNNIQGCPYTDLDGNTGDFCYIYPPRGKRKGGPAIDYEAMREGIDDLRYILTLEEAIQTARARGFKADADRAEALLTSLKNSFDKKLFFEKSVFFNSFWEERKNGNDDRIYVSGEFNLPNGWKLSDYQAAREKIAAEIVRLEKAAVR